MIEFIIFLIIFISVSVTATICALGWLKEEGKNAELLIKKCLLDDKVCSQEIMLEKLSAENRFLRLQLEEKKDEQKSN